MCGAVRVAAPDPAQAICSTEVSGRWELEVGGSQKSKSYVQGEREAPRNTLIAREGPQKPMSKGQNKGEAV